MNRTIIAAREGNCTGNKAGTSLLIPSSIKVELEICS
jgi:hypothetical protein